MAFIVEIPRFTPYIINQRSKVAAVSLVVSILAFLLQVSALVTPGWAQTPDTRLGLFTFCGRLNINVRTESTSHCTAIPWEWEAIHVEIHIVRAAGIISVLLSFVTIIMAAIHLWVVSRQESISTSVVTLCLTMAFLSVISSIVGCTVFGASTRHAVRIADTNYVYELSYSFCLFIVGTASLVVGMVLILASVKSLTRTLLT